MGQQALYPHVAEPRSDNLSPGIYARFVDDEADVRKSAFQMACQLEDQFILEGWPVGRSYGSENALAGRFGFGRVVVREAARILEARGVVRMRRGKRGGLELSAPPLSILLQCAGLYGLFNGVTSSHIVAAEGVLRRASQRQVSEGVEVNPALKLFMLCIQAISAAQVGDLSATGSGHQAEDIVFRLLRDTGIDAWSNGRSLGTQDELAARYGADLRTLRQAIRILEASGAAQSFPGRGRGLVSCAPGPASASRLIGCYFASTGVRPHDAFLASKWISTEAMGLSAAGAQDGQVQAIRERLELVEHSSSADALQGLIDIEKRQIALSTNAVVSLFFRSVNAFPSWGPFAGNALDAPILPELLRCARRVQSAIEAADPVAAMQAQSSKFDLIVRDLAERFPQYRPNS